MRRNARIWVTGHTGMVGRAMMDKLQSEGYYNLIVPSQRIDLCNQRWVNEWYDAVKPEYVFHCAALVGGIKANNQYRADFIYDNLMISANVIHGAFEYGVKKLLKALSNAPHHIQYGLNMTEFPQAMPDDCKRPNPVEGYRQYYIEYKARFAKWTNRTTPHWWHRNAIR